MNRDEIVRACDRLSNKTVTLRKRVSKNKHMRKWVVEFLSKSDNKIVRVNSIRMNKCINLLYLCTGIWVRCDVAITGIGVRCDVAILKLTARALSIHREVFESISVFLTTKKH